MLCSGPRRAQRGPGGGTVTVHVFVGPTLPPQQVLEVIPTAQLHGPARCGDLEPDSIRPCDRVLLIDGDELVTEPGVRGAVGRGVEVVGAAGLGALWAATTPGVSGAGQIYELYRGGLLADADEVMVAHTGAPSFRKLSEALVNIRHALRLAREAGVLGNRCTVALLSHACALPFQQRTWEAIAESVRRSEPSLLSVLALTRGYVAANPGAADLMAMDARRALGYLARMAAHDVGAQVS